jgi:hypothetical protein
MPLQSTEDIRAKSNEELTKVYANSWDYLPDYAEGVKAELLRRGIDLEKMDAAKAQKELLSERMLAQGKQGSSLYILLCFVLTLMGGFLGIIAGYIYSKSKHTSLSGNEYYVYSEGTRKAGRIMMWLGIILLVIFLYQAMMKNAGF